jgi:hypothetical protein
MEKKKGIELIKLEVLGCLNEKDSENLRMMKESEENFPWKELADYQNLVSLLPSSLDVNYPDSELKDKTAMKLYNIRDEIKAKLDAKKPKEVPIASVVEETLEEKPPEPIAEEEINFVEEEKPLVDKVDDKSVKDIPVKTESEVVIQEPENKETIISKPGLDKEAVEKIMREFIKSGIRPELEKIKTDVKNNRLLSIIFFASALILILLLFFIK